MSQASKSMLRWLWIALAVILLDQGTKQLVLQQMQLHQSISVLPFFNLTYLTNPGAAFSFLSEQEGWQRWFFIALAIIVSGVLLAWLRRLDSREFWTAISLSLILGGALGNLIDRLFRGGEVIDFIHLHYGEYYWPAFNVADSAIFVGVVIMLFDALVLSRRRGQ